MTDTNSSQEFSIGTTESDFFKDITAIFGGTFDPPHVGHLQAAKGLLTNPKTKRVVVLVTGSSTSTGKLIHGKVPVASDQDRFEMVRSMFANGPSEIVVDDLEIILSRENGHAFSTFEMIPRLEQKYGPIAMVIGTDQLNSIHSWKHFPAVLESCHWIVLERKDQANQIHQIDKSSNQNSCQILNLLAKKLDFRMLNERLAITKTRKRILIVETSAKAASSTDIRASLARPRLPSEPNAPKNECLHPNLSIEVSNYIALKKLYGC